MKLDSVTAESIRPSVARVYVEIDVSQELPSRVFIQVSNRCISQAVVYEDLPLYYTSCTWMGHKSTTRG